MLSPLSFKPLNLKSLMQDDSETENRNMCKCKKKTTPLVPALVLLSISSLLFLPQVLPKGYFEIKVSVPAVCGA